MQERRQLHYLTLFPRLSLCKAERDKVITREGHDKCAIAVIPTKIYMDCNFEMVVDIRLLLGFRLKYER